MKTKALILLFSLLFLPMVTAAQGEIQVPKPKTNPVAPKPKHKRKPKSKSKPNPKPQVVAKLTYNSSTGELVYGTHRYKMVYVEGGSFDMGATPEQEVPYGNEKPVHRVTLSGYRIGQTEVPQWLWVAVMRNNPSYWKGDNLPVKCVPWDDCQKFLLKLNNITGQFLCCPPKPNGSLQREEVTVAEASNIAAATDWEQWRGMKTIAANGRMRLDSKNQMS